MVFGTVISIVAYGLLTTLKVGTATVVWAAFLVLCGIGMGTAMNIPYTALQVVLRYLFLLIVDISSTSNLNGQ